MKSKTLFPTRLTLLRKQAELSQTEFGRELSLYMGRDIPLSISSISAWELGNKVPSMSTALAIAAYFGVSLDYLFGVSLNPNKEVFIMEDYAGEISQDDLSNYDGQPIYLVYKKNNSLNRWGIYNQDNNYFCCSDVIIKNNPEILQLYALPPQKETSSAGTNQPLTMREVLDCKRIWVQYLSDDVEIRTRNSGWYKHVGTNSNTALQNDEGMMLPYSGLDISFKAYKRKP